MKKNIFLSVSFALLLGLINQSCKKTESLDDTVQSSFVLNQNNLKGTISEGIVLLKSGLTYKLTGALIVNSGATLKIESGAIIEAQTDSGASNLYISIERGGKIEAYGTQASPITFTATGKTMGSWGGLVLHGKAPNNVGENAASEINGTQYGGAISNDNSGILQYCIIRYSGAKNGDKEFNGLSFFSVGSGTTVDHIAIFNGGDDAFEWYGGTVNGSYLYAENNDDDNFDYDLGFIGTLNYLYSINSNSNASSDSRGIEADNNPNAFAVTPISNPTISNVSLIGRGKTATNQKEGIYLRRGVQSKISNIYVSGFPTALGVEHNETIDGIVTKLLQLITIEFGEFTTKSKGVKTDKTVVDISSVFTEGNSNGAGNKADKPTWANWF